MPSLSSQWRLVELVLSSVVWFKKSLPRVWNPFFAKLTHPPKFVLFSIQTLFILKSMHLTSHPLWIFTLKMRPNIFSPHNVDDKEPIKNFFLDFFIVGGTRFYCSSCLLTRLKSVTLTLRQWWSLEAKTPLDAARHPSDPAWGFWI